MIILGIDPGTTSIGYALLDCADRTKLRLRDARLLPIVSLESGDRLMEIHRGIKKIIDQERPYVISLEKLFFFKNAKTVMSVSEARGVILLTAELCGIKVYEYAPLTIKKVLTGDGRADKIQVQKMVHLVLKETQALPSQDDVFDAIASTLCCFYQEGASIMTK